MASTADTPRARQLGAELKALRTGAGLTVIQVGKRVGRSHTHVSRWENGRLLPNDTDLVTMLAVYGVTGRDRDRLVAMAHDAADPNWLAPGMDRQLAALTDYERSAKRVVNVEPMLVPGLMQTADYARSIMIGAGATKGGADQRVMMRLGRRDVLTRRHPVELFAIIGEHALRYPPCERSTMADQLHHIVRLTEQHNVTIRALPLDIGYTAALEGPFALIEFETTKPVVFLEHYRSTATLTDAKDVRDYQMAITSLSKAAMSPEATSELIRRLADEMERET